MEIELFLSYEGKALAWDQVKYTKKELDFAKYGLT